MGDPRRIKNKHSAPRHPWEKLRLDAEKPLMREYGLVNKKELWKVTSKLKNFKDSAKKLVASKTAQAAMEKKQMVDRLKSYGLVSSDSLDELLGLEIEQLLDRRLQTVVFKKGLARSVKQARQMITHKHIVVNGIKVTAPGYLVKVAEEASIVFVPGSKFSREDHPERVVVGSPEELEVLAKKSKSFKKEEVVSSEGVSDKSADKVEKAEVKSADKSEVKSEEKSADKVEKAEDKSADKSVDKVEKAEDKSADDVEKAEKSEVKSEEKSEEKAEVKSEKKFADKVETKSDGVKDDGSVKDVVEGK